jgi:hypothetical protein
MTRRKFLSLLAALPFAGTAVARALQGSNTIEPTANMEGRD